MDIRELVGINLRRLRVGRELPQDALAVDAEIDRAHVSRIERGIENPTVVVLDRLAKALGATVTEFFRIPKRGSKPVAPLKRGRKKGG